MAAERVLFSQLYYGGMIITNREVTWEMSENSGRGMIADLKQVIKKELEEVAKRREKTSGAKAGLPPLKDVLTEDGKGSKVLLNVLDTLNEAGQDDAWDAAIGSEGARNYAGHSGLVGLAFSGGGIRSATFNLGVLQAVEKCGFQSSIDYLSTVSGGGYLGSCLSSLYPI